LFVVIVLETIRRKVLTFSFMTYCVVQKTVKLENAAEGSFHCKVFQVVGAGLLKCHW